jgi:hypothetical protein
MLTALVLTLLLAGGVAACSNSGSDRDRAASAPATSPLAEDSDSGAATGGEASADAAGAGGDVEAASEAPSPEGVDLAAAADRDIIFTASIDVDVEDLDAAAEEARRLAEEAGGFVFGEDTARRSSAQTVLTLKVPPEQFGDLLGALGELGRVDAQQISSDDVTEQVVSLDSRIRTAEASVLRLRALIARAERIEDIAFLEGELLDRETNLETLRGEQRTLERQVDLATITVTMRAANPAPVEDEPQEARDLPSFLDGFHVGWTALVWVGAALLTLLGALAPYVPIAVVVYLVVRWLLRRRRPPAPTTA